MLKIPKRKRGHVILPTAKQKLATDLLLSGKASSVPDAMRQAKYSPSSVNNSGKVFVRSQGVEVYLKSLDEKSREKFGMSIQDKVMNVYYEGLEATKLFGKEAIEHPDHPTRISAADRMASFFGWQKLGIEDESKQYNQFNFFNVKPEKQKLFQENLKSFIKKSYK